MKMVRLVCFLAILGGSAVAAYAQTPIDSNSVIPDPTINLHRPDPACTPGTCVDFEYTGTNSADGGVLFFGASPSLPIPPEYSCTYNDNPLLCYVVEQNSPTFPFLPIAFLGVGFLVNTPLCNGDGCGPQTTFSMNATGIGNPFVLSVPSDMLSCISPACPGGTIALDPIPTTPELGTALLYMTGLVFLVGFSRKRFGANFPS
jgi:hypothetical protein